MITLTMTKPQAQAERVGLSLRKVEDLWRLFVTGDRKGPCVRTYKGHGVPVRALEGLTAADGCGEMSGIGKRIARERL